MLLGIPPALPSLDARNHRRDTIQELKSPFRSGNPVVNQDESRYVPLSKPPRRSEKPSIRLCEKYPHVLLLIFWNPQSLMPASLVFSIVEQTVSSTAAHASARRSMCILSCCLKTSGSTAQALTCALLGRFPTLHSSSCTRKCHN